MTDTQFGRVIDLPYREAWNHQEDYFLLWIAKNVDYLARASGPATGVSVYVMASLQVRNTAGDMQFDGTELGCDSNIGDLGVANYCPILETER